MPYLVSIYEPGGCLDPIGARQEPDSTRPVATLDEARGALWDFYASWKDVHGDQPPWQGEVELNESGGTIGPLADGTVIEVQPVTWGELGGDTLYPTNVANDPRDRKGRGFAAEHVAKARAEIIDAYSRAQGLPPVTGES